MQPPLSIADEETEAQRGWVLSESHAESSGRVGTRNPNVLTPQDSVHLLGPLLCLGKHLEVY